MDEGKVIHSGGPQSSAEEQNMLCVQHFFLYVSFVHLAANEGAIGRFTGMICSVRH